MVSFNTPILKFGEQGEKTGWSYIEIPTDIAQKLKPNNKRSFRVKGKLDAHKISGVALLPMGGGNFIMPINAAMRRGIGKRKGAIVNVQLELDPQPLKINNDFLECLNDDPAAASYFSTLAKGHQNYFSKWIESAKTELTKTKRIAMAVSALSRRLGFPEMLREEKANRLF
jgi:hypothetical protein